MDSLNRLKRCAARKWLWWFCSWRLLPDVASLLSEFDSLRSTWDRHIRDEVISKDEKKTLLRFKELAEAGEAHKAEKERVLKEVEELRAKYLGVLAGRKVKEGRLSEEAIRYRDQAHLLQIELGECRAKLEAHQKEHQMAKDGNRALLRFIHTRHRLNMKFDQDSIRSALQRADEKK